MGHIYGRGGQESWSKTGACRRWFSRKPGAFGGTLLVYAADLAIVPLQWGSACLPRLVFFILRQMGAVCPLRPDQAGRVKIGVMCTERVSRFDEQQIMINFDISWYFFNLLQA
jgi:hypothetical protein